ncbi:MAG: haloacid dehalogenase-like hydrolase, partial [Candidatus Harrisonbacteria bacterium]|nr:haloacid dehalogenase-like hydrolase [Candidatus Harrisonbacteria bacterium]
MKKKIAVFDIDGTLFRNSLLIELHWKLVKEGIFPSSVRSDVDELYWAWVNRERSYDEYIQRVVDSFHEQIKGKAVQTLNEIAARVVERQSKIVYVFTRDLIEELRKDHILIAISGSPNFIVEAFTKKWNFDYAV